MRCNEIREKLDLYIDGKLQGKEKDSVDTHLAQCGYCRKEYTDLKAMEDCFKAVPVFSAPDSFTLEVMKRIGLSNRNVLADWFDFIFTPRILKWNMAVAVSLVILIGSSIFILPRTKFLNSEKTVTVRFQLEIPESQGVSSVSLAGDFNGWDTKTMLLTRDNGTWNIEVPLKKGRYQYMFVVDGEKWVPDPKAKRLINDGFGGKNSLLEL